MDITLDKAKKIVLLQALKGGSIDSKTLTDWVSNAEADWQQEHPRDNRLPILTDTDIAEVMRLNGNTIDGVTAAYNELMGTAGTPGTGTTDKDIARVLLEIGCITPDEVKAIESGQLHGGKIDFSDFTDNELKELVRLFVKATRRKGER
ncbi:MAG: hypothetical protein J5725_08265 [Bacteroidales bacterium]|nr:hypothetical protein [Bacteroidales bacterium]